MNIMIRIDSTREGIVLPLLFTDINILGLYYDMNTSRSEADILELIPYDWMPLDGWNIANTAKNTNQSINQSNIWFDTGSICNEKTLNKFNINGLVEDNIITDSAFF